MTQHPIPMSTVVVPPREGGAASPVTLSIPADPDFLVLVRSAVSHLGSRVGLSLPELEDLRLAANEACSLFLVPDEGYHATGFLDCRFTLSGGSLHLRIAADVDPVCPPPFRRFGWALLEALVDETSWDVRERRATVHLVKRPAGGELGW
jgi:serine/threonine-protein kinase RsbW